MQFVASNEETTEVRGISSMTSSNEVKEWFRSLGLSELVLNEVSNFVCGSEIGVREVKELLLLEESDINEVKAFLPKVKAKRLDVELELLRTEGQQKISSASRLERTGRAEETSHKKIETTSVDRRRRLRKSISMPRSPTTVDSGTKVSFFAFEWIVIFILDIPKRF